MLNAILFVILSATNTPILAQIKPCVWPNPCAKPVKVAQVSTCVWPNKCSKPVKIAQVRPCVWPNKCVKETTI
ncbi:MAG: hypothetical protein HY400_05795 [Elusimicrobia bacterium]|nr:hypothetical protein [Elusimicrobiota bacterium]